MTIKSFFADTVAAAMREARKELGEEAMLLKSRRAPDESRHLGAYEVVFGVVQAAGEQASGPQDTLADVAVSNGVPSIGAAANGLHANGSAAKGAAPNGVAAAFAASESIWDIPSIRLRRVCAPRRSIGRAPMRFTGNCSTWISTKPWPPISPNTSRPACWRQALTAAGPPPV